MTNERMEIDRTWEIVDSLDWPGDPQIHRVRNQLRELLSPEDCDRFERQLTALAFELACSMEQYSDENGGMLEARVDNLQGFQWHVVAEGREAWKRCVDDPAHAFSRARRRDEYEDGFNHAVYV